MLLPVQRLKVWGAFEELQDLRKVPDLGPHTAFATVNLSSNITLTSNAWTIGIDPDSGTDLSPFSISILKAHVWHLIPT